jgi:disulfide bond formation protein DsbB
MLLGPILYTLGSLAIVAVAWSIMGIGVLALPRGRRWIRGGRPETSRRALTAAWIAATTATGASLYLSEGVGLLPCELCWYQRIAMYPLAVVLGVGLLRREAGAWRYALPLSVGGGLIALYHVVLQLRPQLEIGECSALAPCTMAYFKVFGFITIPWMAASVFLFVTVLLVAMALNEGRPSTKPS